jgi:predicted alpha-1,2-mannosidase
MNDDDAQEDGSTIDNNGSLRRVNRRWFLQAVAGTGAATFGADLGAATQSEPPPDGSDVDPVDHVNPFVGTDWFVEGGVHRGNTFPGPTRPFGMVQLSPDTAGPDGGAQTGYAYGDDAVKGFSHTHLSGTGCSGYGHFLVTATVGSLETEDSAYQSTFDHDSETAEPGYYAARLEDYDVRAELTTTRRVGVHRYTFPRTEDGHILIDATHFVEGNSTDIDLEGQSDETPTGSDSIVSGEIEILSEKNVITGQTTLTEDFCGGTTPYSVYFYARFETPFDSFGTWDDEAPNGGVRHGSTSASGEDIGAFVNYDTNAGDEVELRVGVSFVSADQARRNLEAELDGESFDEVRGDARAEWNDHLGRIEVGGGTPAQRRTFYSSLYHSLLYPQTYSDVDGTYIGMDGEVYTAEGYTQYATFSLWDTFRSLTPLLILAYPEYQRDMVQSLVSHYETGGWLPKWSLANIYTNTMVGDHATPIIVSTYLKGIRDFDVETAYEAMYKSATQVSRGHDYEGRRGLEYYEQFGYVPFATYSPEDPEILARHQTSGDNWHLGEDTVYDQSVSRTAEFAYDDWALAAMARALGRTSDYERFVERSQNYQNVFDPETGFMRPRYASGNWLRPWSPQLWSGFSEGNSWMFSWFVPHSVDCMVEAMGGRQTVIDRLDQFFSEFVQPTFFAPVSNYWHGNEPDQQSPYLYNYVGQPWKTQELVREILDQLYGPGPSGLSGNDDMGQISAWNVLTAMGFHPTSPASTHYEIGSPLFEEARVELDERYYDADEFTIEAPGASAENKYVQSASVGGRPLDRSWISHFEIQEGADLSLQMGSTPNREWASGPEATPPSRASIPDLTIVADRASASSGEQRRTIVAELTDESGAVVANAPIIWRVEGGDVFSRSEKTDDRGRAEVEVGAEDVTVWVRYPGSSERESAIAATAELPDPDPSGGGTDGIPAEVVEIRTEEPPNVAGLED